MRAFFTAIQFQLLHIHHKSVGRRACMFVVRLSMAGTVLIGLSSIPGFAILPPAGKHDTTEQRVKKFHDLLDEQWQYTLRTQPEFASIMGDKRFNDQLTDYSQAAVEQNLREIRRFLRAFEVFDATGFNQQDKLSRSLMVLNLRQQIEGARFKDWEMPVNQFSGIHIDLPQLVSSLAFESVKDYEDYIARLNQVPRAFDEVIVQMRRGLVDGLIPPKILLDQVAVQASRIADQKAEDSPFAQPVKRFPAGIP